MNGQFFCKKCPKLLTIQNFPPTKQFTIAHHYHSSPPLSKKDVAFIFYIWPKICILIYHLLIKLHLVLNLIPWKCAITTIFSNFANIGSRERFRREVGLVNTGRFEFRKLDLSPDEGFLLNPSVDTDAPCYNNNLLVVSNYRVISSVINVHFCSFIKTIKQILLQSLFQPYVHYFVK